MKRGTRLCALLLAALALCACGRSTRRVRYFSYLEEPISLCLSGQLDGLSFTATLQSEGRPASTGDRAANTADFTLTYLSPPALAGVRVHYDAQTGDISVRLGELHAQGDSYAALCQVGSLLLGESPVTSAGRQADGSIRFETMDGATRVIDQNGRPTHLAWSGDGRRIEVDVE